jgi:hypothetical protein
VEESSGAVGIDAVVFFSPFMDVYVNVNEPETAPLELSIVNICLSFCFVYVDGVAVEVLL